MQNSRDWHLSTTNVLFKHGSCYVVPSLICFCCGSLCSPAACPELYSCVSTRSSPWIAFVQVLPPEWHCIMTLKLLQMQNYRSSFKTFVLLKDASAWFSPPCTGQSDVKHIIYAKNLMFYTCSSCRTACYVFFWNPGQCYSASAQTAHVSPLPFSCCQTGSCQINQCCYAACKRSLSTFQLHPSTY